MIEEWSKWVGQSPLAEGRAGMQVWKEAEGKAGCTRLAGAGGSVLSRVQSQEMIFFVVVFVLARRGILPPGTKKV